MAFENVKCSKHQKYECTVCVEVEGPITRARRLEREVAELKGRLVSTDKKLVDANPEIQRLRDALDRVVWQQADERAWWEERIKRDPHGDRSDPDPVCQLCRKHSSEGHAADCPACIPAT